MAKRTPTGPISIKAWRFKKIPASDIRKGGGVWRAQRTSVVSKSEIKLRPDRLMHPFRTLEIAAERIADGPQTSLDVVQALQKLVGKLERWRLLYVWECLRFDVAAEPHRLMGAQQNLNEALNGIAMKLKMERMDIVALSKLASRDWAR